MQLVPVNLPAADLYQACEELNRLGLAEHVLCLEAKATGTAVVLRVSDESAPAVRALLGYSDPANPPRYALGIDRRWVPPRP